MHFTAILSMLVATAAMVGAVPVDDPVPAVSIRSRSLISY